MRRLFSRILVPVVGLATLLSAPLALAASITDQGSSTANQTSSGITSFLNTIWNKAPGWIAAMVVFAFSFVIAKVMKEKVVDKVSAQFSEDDQDILVLIGRTTYVGVLAVGVTIALNIAGIDLTAIIAAVGFGVGFAMQDLVMNFMAGVLILLNRQFTIGDFIKINDTVGKVEEIQSRATILKALDGTRVIVPNADLFTNQVTSFTSNPFRRIEVPVGVEYRTDLSQAHQAIYEALMEHSGVLREPAPAIILSEFADSSINFLVRFWVDSHSKWIQTKSDVIQLIKKHLDEQAIGIPFPIRTLVFDKDTEDVVLPTYQMSQPEMQAKISQRDQEEKMLSEAIAATADRATKNSTYQPTSVPTPSVAPVAKHPSVGAEDAAPGAEFLASDSGAVPADEEENVTATAEAAKSVQAEQDQSKPVEVKADEVQQEAAAQVAAKPEADIENGADFLKA
jgi:small conductance mechanosensitive channel